MKKLILIDGNSLLFRAYFAMRPMITSKGMHTQGVFAFVNMLGKIMNDYEPTHMAVAFDLKGGTFRHDVYKEYKAGRLKTPPELLSQIPLLHDVLDAMNIAVLEVPQYEADDIIGTVSARAEKDGIDTLVISGDIYAVSFEEFISRVNNIYILHFSISECPNSAEFRF